MLTLSVMGLILSIQRFQVGLLSSNINAYGTFDDNVSCVLRKRERKELLG